MMKRVMLLTVLVFALVFAGCSKAPVAEIEKCEAALTAAQTAEADQYAPDAFRAAMDSLNAAKAVKAEQDGKFALFRSYGKAKEMFISAEVLAQKALTEAQQNKEMVRQEVMQIITETKTFLDSTALALEKAPVGKGNKADIELIKSDLASTQAAFDDANNDFAAGRYLVAKTKFQGVMANAQRIIAEIENAKMKKAGK